MILQTVAVRFYYFIQAPLSLQLLQPRAQKCSCTPLLAPAQTDKTAFFFSHRHSSSQEPETSRLLPPADHLRSRAAAARGAHQHLYNRECVTFVKVAILWQKVMILVDFERIFDFRTVYFCQKTANLQKKIFFVNFVILWQSFDLMPKSWGFFYLDFIIKNCDFRV